MAFIASTKNGNWSSASTWVGGVVPGNGDSAIINHAVVVDTNTTIGPSAAAFTTQATPGCYAFAILVNGPYPDGANAHNATYNQYCSNGNAGVGLTIAAGVTLTARGDTILNGAILTLNAGSVYLFDSSQAAAPTATVYTIDLFTTWPAVAKIVAMGVAGNRAQIIGNVAGGGSAGRFTAGEKMVGYPNWDGGVLNFSYAYCKYVGNASINMIQLRIGNGAYSFFLDHSIFDTCGMLNHSTAVDVGAANNMNFSITNCTWRNSADRSRSYNSYGMSIPGTSVYLAFNARTGGQTNTFNITGNVFDNVISLYSSYYLNFSNNIVIGFPDFAICYNLTYHNNIIYEGYGYLSGGGMTTGYGADIQNCYFIQDSANNLNSHVLFISGGTDTAGLGGNCVVKNNIFEQSQCANGYYGGNCLISTPGIFLGAGTTTTIANNIILPTNSSTSDSWNSGSPVFGQFVSAGTLVTMLHGVDPANGYNGTTMIPHHFLNNTCAMPTGIGSIDPDENGAGLAGMFAEIRSNIFWKDATAASLHGAGNAIFWNTNGHGRVPTVDECVSTNITNNTFINPVAGTGCYMGLPIGETAFLPANFVATPGYKDGFFSSTTPPGTNDINQNPNFNDPTRNTWRFDMANGGPSTGQSTYTIMQKFALVNDDTGFDSYYTITNLLAYVRAGFIPTNQAIKGQGYGGVDPGAMPVLQSLVWTTPAGSIGSALTGTSFNFTFAATDPNSGYTLSYVASGLPAGLTVNSSTGVLSGTLPAVSINTVYPFTVMATDGLLVNNRSFTLTNTAWVGPVWTTPTGLLGSGVGGTPASYSVAATDPQAATVSFTLVSGLLPPGMTLNGTTGVISGTPSVPGSTTTYSFTLAATNGHVPTNQIFSIQVYAYTAPVWTTAAGTIGSYAPGAHSVTVVATDPQSFALTYAAVVALPTFLTLNANTGAISGTFPPSGASTTYNFSISAFNGYLTTTRSFSITALPYPSPSWNTAAGSLGAAVGGSTFSATVSATDPSGLPLAYTVSQNVLPPGLSLNGATGVISGTDTNLSSSQTFPFSITASNGYTSSVQTFSIGDTAILPPVWTTAAGTISSSSMLMPMSVQLVATDPQSLALTYTLSSGGVPGVTLSSTGLVSGTLHAVTTTTNYSMTVVVSNGISSSTQTFTVTAQYVSPIFTHFIITA